MDLSLKYLILKNSRIFIMLQKRIPSYLNFVRLGFWHISYKKDTNYHQMNLITNSLISGIIINISRCLEIKKSNKKEQFIKRENYVKINICP